MTKVKIGWIGLGTMGTPMVKNLLIKGFPVCVYNRTLEKHSSFMGEEGIASDANLCLNYFLALTFQGLSETVLFAQRENIDKEAMLRLVNESALGSEIIRLKSQTILSNDFSPAFALKH